MSYGPPRPRASIRITRLVQDYLALQERLRVASDPLTRQRAQLALAATLAQLKRYYHYSSRRGIKHDPSLFDPIRADL